MYKKLKINKTNIPSMSQRWKEPYKGGPIKTILAIEGSKEEWEETSLACPFCQEVSFVYSRAFQGDVDYLGKQLLCISCESKFQLPEIHFHAMLDFDDKARIKQLGKFSILRDEKWTQPITSA